ncbi:MAG TPA: thiamine pyrophosphate-binding protein [Bacteroidales bacterium]|nr:thiamine pyrophosphate-binding protein [Bacteroidales bacterium]
MTIAEYLALKLRDHGVRRFFGIPGGPSIPYMEAFRKQGIEFFLTSHESAAAVMADVTARLTGVMGVCHGTFGPGATNLSTGVGGALLDRSPLLALTSEMSDDWLNRTTQMNIDHQALYRPLTKATFRLSDENVVSVTDEALETAYAEYPGPVHIGLPTDLHGKTALETLTKRERFHEAGDDYNSKKASVLIASSHRPLLAVGLTALRHGLADHLKTFLEKHQVPVVITPMAKGILEQNNPCYAGVLFHAMSDRLQKLTREADLVIGIGYDPVEYNYESWMPSVPLVHFDTRMTDIPGRGNLQIVSGPEKWFEMLEPLRSSPEMVSLAGEVRNEMAGTLAGLSKGFGPVRALQILREELPGNAVVTSDVGSHLHLLGQMWDAGAPGKLIITNGWSSMGFGLPAAIAAAMCCRNVPVVCITGDGGMMMNAGEIMTARRYGIKVIVIVLADRELNLISLKEGWKGIDPYGVSLYKGPLFSSDSFLGVKVFSVADGDAMRKAVREALLSDTSVIIETAVDPSEYSDLVVKV